MVNISFLWAGGWAYADAAIEASVAICGNFLHAANLRLQAEVWRLEGILGVRAQHRYPAFQQVLCTSLLPCTSPNPSCMCCSQWAIVDHDMCETLHVRVAAASQHTELLSFR
jgi:hypothetical protein